MDKIWVVEDPDEKRASQRTKRLTQEGHPPVEKDPAVAYTLSLLVWGAGQMYNGQKEKGQWFFFFMLLSGAATFFSLVYWRSFLDVLRSPGISGLSIFLFAEVLLFCALVFWTYNAGDAYHTAVRARKTPFTEVPSRVMPFLCSLLIPGWGQHLNGQPIKGSIFSCCLIFSLFAVVSIPVILLAWPSLQTSAARTTIEGIFMLMVLFAPLIPLVWILSSYDALKISLDDIRKERIFDRIKYANNRRRAQGLVRGVIPHIRLTIFLMLVLVFLLIISNHYFPKEFYRDILVDAQTWLQTRGMTFVPTVIGKLSSVMR
jgi:hypothetical protein